MFSIASGCIIKPNEKKKQPHEIVRYHQKIILTARDALFYSREGFLE
jgi:hypothetical protein